MKRKILLTATALLLVSLIAFGSLSYFTASDRVTNVITAGNIEIKLHEETADGTPFPQGGVIGAMPGVSYDKKVYAENTSAHPAWVRMKVSVDTPFRSAVSFDINSTDWTYRDGYYYYNTPLSGNRSTTPLFTKVTFDASMDNSFKNTACAIDVKLEAVQSENNGTDFISASGFPGGETK